jgi:hypothetical protein
MKFPFVCIMMKNCAILMEFALSTRISEGNFIASLVDELTILPSNIMQIAEVDAEIVAGHSYVQNKINNNIL